MRKSYADYGLSEDRAKELLKECQVGEHAVLVRTAAYKADPLTAEHVILSIMQGKSYDALMVKWELREIERVPCGRTDFYGTRRQTVAILNNLLSGKEAE